MKIEEGKTSILVGIKKVSSENNGEVSNHLVDNSPSVKKDSTIVVIDDWLTTAWNFSFL